MAAFALSAYLISYKPTRSATIIGMQYEGHYTYSGEVLDQRDLVCATKKGKYSIGAWLRVRTVEADPMRTVYVRNIDRLPDTANSDIDLSVRAAELLSTRTRFSVTIELAE